MQPLRRGRYRVRLAASPDDLRAAQHLRWLCFCARDGASGDGAHLDADAWDHQCRHLLVTDTATDRLVCCLRILPLTDGRGVGRSYSAQFYDLSALKAFDAPMIEVGRFCIHPLACDPDIIRMAWAALTRIVDDTGARMLFGCSSFAGTEPAAHAEAFVMLQARHLAPRQWRPRIKAPHVFRLAQALRSGPCDPRRALAAMPPLLRSYLALGGWVSDHAVVDPALRTMHVFTGIEIASIPPARQRLLRSLAQ